jgi:hypothetical protein
MRTKLHNSIFYNKYKQEIPNIKSGGYGRFIIDINGLWLHNNELWFQWYLIQGETNDSLVSDKYMFIDENISKPPPPPPPLPVFRKSSDKIIINKKGNKKKPLDKVGGFSPPSLDELQITLSKLKKI